MPSFRYNVGLLFRYCVFIRYSRSVLTPGHPHWHVVKHHHGRSTLTLIWPNVALGLSVLIIILRKHLVKTLLIWSCSAATKVNTECSSRLYVFDRTPGYRLEGAGDKELFASNRTECEDKCLGEIAVVCRSATFDRAAQRCRISPETKYMNPQAFKQDANSEYVENLCLSGESVCFCIFFLFR